MLVQDGDSRHIPLQKYRIWKHRLYLLTVCSVFLFSFLGHAEPLRIGVAGAEYSYTVRKTSKTLRKLGVKVVRIDSVRDDIDSLDGLVIPGGPDINPGRYDEDNYACEGIRNSLDRIQFTVLDVFVRTGKPVYGICRGMQLINVYFNGTLNQDIPGHRSGTHEVVNIRGTWCFDIFGETIETNTSHHQSVKRLGDGLVECAYSGDTIEAVRHSKLPIFGTQWHPEYKPKKTGKKVLQYWLNLVRLHKTVSSYIRSGIWY